MWFSLCNFQYSFSEIPSLDDMKTRISQNFFNVFTILPISVICFGGLIIYYGVNERKIQDSRISKKLIMIGNIIIFLGLLMFSFYLLD
jgi:hypothetical protein